MSAQSWEAWSNRNPEKSHARFRKWRDRNPKYYPFYGAKRRAKRDGTAFNIKIGDVPNVPEKCPVLGIPLFKRSDGRGGPCDNSPTLDRIDPDKGYVLGNIAIISFKANRWKSNMRKEDLEKILNYMNTAPGLSGIGIQAYGDAILKA